MVGLGMVNAHVFAREAACIRSTYHGRDIRAVIGAQKVAIA